MIVLRFKVQCQPSKVQQLETALAAVVVPSRALDGVIEFDVARDLHDPNAFIATEVFEDDDALARQESLPEVGAVMKLLPDALVAPPAATIYRVAATESAL
jgi:quinol monooxygenase YgiN